MGDPDLDAVLANNTFAEGSRVVENMILIPPDSAIYNVEKNKYYGSIQGAIDDAGDGNTILVGRGHTKEFNYPKQKEQPYPERCQYRCACRRESLETGPREHYQGQHYRGFR